MAATAFMLVVLVCGYLAMIALVSFAEHVIERPQVAKLDHKNSGSSGSPVSR